MEENIMYTLRPRSILHALSIAAWLLLTWGGPATPVQAAPAPASYTAVSAGEEHTCALTTTGGVKCWGKNWDGRLGNGTESDGSATPVDVMGLTSGVTAISVGATHTCALTVTGGVKCWGDNSAGELGDGTTISRNRPVNVHGLTSGVIAISSGWASTCALTSSGGVKCWGENYNGQLGNGNNTDSATPVNVDGLNGGVIAISVGTRHACAVVNTGLAICWGDNENGALGDGTNIDSNHPMVVVRLTGVMDITAGLSLTCALTNGGGVYCWGYNENGELGNGTNASSNVPVAVPGLNGGVKAITTSNEHVCALLTGGVKCWGYNILGQLGNGTLTNSNIPVDVAGLAGDITDISAGGGHTCVILNGSVMCWGGNYEGQIGTGILGSHSTVPVNAMASASAISTSSSHTCAIDPAQGVKCWGWNFYGQLGDGTTEDKSAPVDVLNLTAGASAVSSGTAHTCATVHGSVMCWGDNEYGQLGDGTLVNSSVPVAVAQGFDGLSSISAGGYHTCVLANGSPWCWGSNSGGQLGDTTFVDRTTPVPVIGLPDRASQISAGDGHSCALLVDGSVWCWGSNQFGQLGNDDDTYSSSAVPVIVVGLTGHIVAISSGSEHTCALTDIGGLKCWGMNWTGQLGTGSTDPILSKVPVDVIGLAGSVTSVAAGSRHTCAETTDGVKCWGSNDSGQLGDGTTTDKYSPVAVAGLTEDVSALSLGWGMTCALTSGGAVKCWGSNGSGTLGDGTAWYTAPVPAVSVPASPPGVNSILRTSPTPTNLDSVDFTVTFSASVTGVDTSAPFGDFSLVTNGVQGAAITAVSGSGNQYTVSVSTGSSSGTIRLDVVDDDSILDPDSVPLGGPGAGNGDFFTGDVYDVRTVTLDDELDPRFGAPNGYVQLSGSSPRTSIQADGRILLMVEANAVETRLIRLLEDGTPDSGFGTNGRITFPKESVTSFAVGADGRIVAVGVCNGENYEVRLQRFLSNGKPDTAFNNGKPLCKSITAAYDNFGVSRVLVQPDAKIVVLAHSWWCGGGISEAGIQAGGGHAGMWCEAPSFLIRFDSHGNLDPAFGSNGVFDISIPDPPTTSTMVNIYDLLIQKNGSFLMMATVTDNHASQPYLAVLRLTSQGQLDGTFDGDGAFIYYEPAVNHYGCALAVQQNGRILVTGSEGTYNNSTPFLLGITANGAIDTSFGSAGKTILPESSCTLLTLPNNGIVTAGFATANLVIRMFDPDGTVNPFFANGWMAASDALGSPNALHLQPNGKIVLTSSTGSQTFVARLRLLFEDVNYFHWAQPWIERLYASGITAGCATSPLRYCPAKPVTRAQMAVFLLRGIHGPSYTPPPVGASTGFADVPVTHPNAAWIKQLAAEGITAGCGGGNYCPNNPVRRAQMAYFLLRSKYGSSYTPPPVGASTGFADVPAGSPDAPWIKQIVAEGITAGCGAGNYCPTNPVTRDQMAVFLVRTFSLP
jgi:uncharacterized delta-60 repeat protein